MTIWVGAAKTHATDKEFGVEQNNRVAMRARELLLIWHKTFLLMKQVDLSKRVR
ncbi:hypothetical protein MED121_20636 [Marinomonas sp. MED121]|nr:hypothetical protein MED121_20636 [Marinomonas sp. MED121]